MTKMIEIEQYEYLLEILKNDMNTFYKEEKYDNTLKDYVLPEVLKNNIMNKNIKCYSGKEIFYFVSNDEVLFIGAKEVIQFTVLLSSFNQTELVEDMANVINGFTYLFNKDYFMYDEDVSDESHNAIIDILKSIDVD